MSAIDVQAMIDTARAVEHLPGPPSDDLVLWQSALRTIYVESIWGPPVPYGSVERVGQESNYGYRSVKGAPEAIDQIPEVADWPELASLLKVINAAGSPVESVGCAVGFFDADNVQPGAKKVGSYVDVVFSDPQLAQSIAPHLHLAARIAHALDGCEQWWGSIELGLQRLKHLPGTTRPWGLMLKPGAVGRTHEEARTMYRETLARLEGAFSAHAPNGA